MKLSKGMWKTIQMAVPSYAWAEACDVCRKKYPEHAEAQLEADATGYLVLAYYGAELEDLDGALRYAQEHVELPAARAVLQRVGHDLQAELRETIRHRKARQLLAEALFHAPRRRTGTAQMDVMLAGLLDIQAGDRVLGIDAVWQDVTALAYQTDGVLCYGGATSEERRIVLSLQSALMEGDLPELSETSMKDMTKLWLPALEEAEPLAAWTTLQHFAKAMAKGARMVACVPIRLLTSETGAEVRRALAAECLSAVISLPEAKRGRLPRRRALPGQDKEAMCFLVFGPRAGASIRMVAAELDDEISLMGLTEAAVQRVVAFARDGGACVKDIGYEDLTEDASLLPGRYVAPPLKKYRRVALQDVAEIMRGASPLKLKGLRTEEPTAYHVIGVGSIAEPLAALPYLAGLPEASSCVRPGDIVMTRVAPYRLRLADESFAKKDVVADGNVYLMRVKDDAGILPIVLYLYLSSAEGQAQLDHSGSGSMLNIISRKNLGAVEIPLLSKAQQESIQASYQEMKQKLEAAEAQVADLHAQIAGLLRMVL